MNEDERESIIEQLALIQGVSILVFENYSDERLLEEMKKYYE